MDKDPDRAWFDSYDEIEKAREGDRADTELEARMTELANTHSGLVLDTWAMAWIYNGSTPMVRLWIESDEDSRTRKCFVSQGSDKQRDLDASRLLITQKDGDTRAKFIRRLDFDLFTDRHRYDVILDNTQLIPEATEASAKTGITIFSPVVLAAVKYCINKITNQSFDIDRYYAKNLINSSNGMIISLGSEHKDSYE
ncbi:MAG TPA: hypothetical protein VFN31_01980 [Candidatus Saccharimonadales bacterium]|nr:hypothetical protein [Candidatus Saccharimonadales bacterium]